MKTIDYINSLIKENENLKATCKSHVETIRLIRRDLGKLNTTISKQDKKIQKLESESLNVKTQKEIDRLKNELNDLREKYNEAMIENANLKSIFDDIDKLDSEQ